MVRWLPPVVCLAVVLASGWTAGFWDGRWSSAHEAEAAAARLSGLPTVVGDWDMKDEITINPSHLARAEVMGHLARRYVHRVTGKEITVFVVCGRPGPISVHPPEACYGGAGYEILGSQEKCEVACGPDGRRAELYTATFGKKGAAVPDEFQLYWGWNASGTWQAAWSPRWSFGGERFLFKMYLMQRSLPTQGSSHQDEPCVNFLQEWEPSFHRIVFVKD